MNIDQLRLEINRVLIDFVDRKCSEISEIDDQLTPVAKAIKDFVSDGKRFRPIFSLLGYLGAGGKIDEPILRASVSLELLQASALIHDDLMDGSDSRRGKPAIHKQFSKLHGENFGSSAAILIGDLALVWSEEALNESGISIQSLLALNPINATMRSELMAGQFLDVYEQTQSDFSIERSLKIARYKSGKYSIERPLHFGAALAGSDDLEKFLSIYSEYGLPLGEAFQLRDDLLGVFGDPNETGKPAGDDLIEGKRTALIAYAYERGDEKCRTLLKTKLGKKLEEAEIEELRNSIVSSGAVTHIEDLIEKLSESALDAIERDELNKNAKELLVEMVERTTKRSK